MTRNNQVLRAWISKTKPNGPWYSNVSYAGRVSSQCTNSTHRRAAVEYNHLHIYHALRAPSGTPLSLSTHDEPTSQPSLL